MCGQEQLCGEEFGAEKTVKTPGELDEPIKLIEKNNLKFDHICSRFDQIKNNGRAFKLDL